MNRLNRFLAMSASEKVLFLEAAGLVAVFRLGVAMLPFKTIRRVVRAMCGGRSAARPRNDIGAAVRRAGRVVPFSNCLSEGLAGVVLLSRAGHPCELRVGVTRTGVFGAHAWVESCGEVLIGDHDGTYAAAEGATII